jgi:hypothetical protein
MHGSPEGDACLQVGDCDFRQVSRSTDSRRLRSPPASSGSSGTLAIAAAHSACTRRRCASQGNVLGSVPMKLVQAPTCCRTASSALRFVTSVW